MTAAYCPKKLSFIGPVRILFFIEHAFQCAKSTGICGGSAIAAIAPTIGRGRQHDVAYAMSATFLFDMAMIVLFPIMGRAHWV